MDDYRITQENEQALLGALLLDNTAIGDVEGLLSKDDFYFQDNQIIYSAIVYKYACGHRVDPLTLASYLRENGKIKQVGGASYISSLIDEVPDIASAGHYADQIKSFSLARKMRSMASTIINNLEKMSPADVIDQSLGSILQIAETATDSNQVQVGSVVDAVVDNIIKVMDGEKKDKWVSTGYLQMDRVLLGLKPGEMIVLAARPSFGKTALATNIAINVAMRGEPVLFFSLEMPKEKVVLRILSCMTRIPYRRIESKSLSKDDIEKIRSARDKLRTVPLIIDDSSTQTLSSIRTKCRRQYVRSGLALVVLDYLQLACSDPEDRGQVSMWSKGLKAIGRDIGVTMLPVAQLSRYVEHRDDKRPVLADLRGSGQIEQDADVVMFIWHRDKNLLHKVVSVDKNRNGPLAEIEYRFNNSITLFEEMPIEVPE